MAKTANELVKYAKAQLGKPYWYGAYGQAASKSVYDMYKSMYPKYYKWDFTPEVVGQKVHDCVGLIKGYLWCNDPQDTKPKYDSANDRSANMTRDICAINGKISTIPEVPGMLVFMDGHVGVYIGNGEVIEARGHAYGVVKTKLADRPWKTWGRHPHIVYEGIHLHRGIKSDAVKDLQEKLIKLKYDVGSSGVDGSYGGATTKAVMAFQRDNNLTANGVYDEATKVAMDKALTPKPEVPPIVEPPITVEPPVVEPPVIEPPVVNPTEPPKVEQDVENTPEEEPEIKEEEKVEEEKKEPSIDDENATLLSKLLKLLIELVNKLLGKNK